MGRFSEFLSKKTCSCEPSVSIHLSFELRQRSKNPPTNSFLTPTVHEAFAAEIQCLNIVEYSVLRACEAFKEHCTLIYAPHTCHFSMFFLWHTEQAKELYSCKESCTWCWALEQLQCVTCTQEQLPLKPRSKLFVELDTRSFSRTLQGNTRGEMH